MTDGNSIRREALGGYLRGNGEALDSFIHRVRGKLDYLGNTCAVHFAWYTHRNLAGCWICDSLTITAVLLDELERMAPYIDEGREHLNGEVPPKDS